LPKHVVITGASGQIGIALVHRLAARGHKITAIARSRPEELSMATKVYCVDLAKDPLPEGILTNDSIVLHLAGTVPREAKTKDPSGSINAAIAKNLVLSRPGQLINLGSLSASVAEARPDFARQYGHEKLAAERIFAASLPGGSVVYLRPPTIYGETIKGPVMRLAALVRRGVPLPLASVTTPRPYMSLGNLLSLFQTLVETDDLSAVANGPLEVHDGELVRTCDLVRHLASAQGIPARIVPAPVRLLRLAGRVTGKSELVSGAIDPVPCNMDSNRLGAIGWSPTEKMPNSLRFLHQGNARKD